MRHRLTLSEREVTILAERGRGMSFADIAANHSITRARAHQVFHRAQWRIRAARLAQITNETRPIPPDARAVTRPPTNGPLT